MSKNAFKDKGALIYLLKFGKYGFLSDFQLYFPLNLTAWSPSIASNLGRHVFLSLSCFIFVVTWRNWRNTAEEIEEILLYPDLRQLAQGKVIERSLPAPVWCTCGPKNPLKSQFIYIGELIYKNRTFQALFFELRPIKDSAPTLRGSWQPSHYLTLSSLFR